MHPLGIEVVDFYFLARDRNKQGEVTCQAGGRIITC